MANSRAESSSFGSPDSGCLGSEAERVSCVLVCVGPRVWGITDSHTLLSKGILPRAERRYSTPSMVHNPDQECSTGAAAFKSGEPL